MNPRALPWRLDLDAQMIWSLNPSPDNRKKILVIEDEPAIAEMVAVNLRSEGFDVALAPDGTRGLACQEESPSDLIVLDLMLPDMDGFEVLRILRRKQDRVPVLVLTARNSKEDMIQGLSYGADDYLGKPFSILELLARIPAILRRTDSGVQQTRTLKSGPFRINFVTLSVQRAKVDLNLSLREFRILEVLLTHPGRVHSRREILNMAWDPQTQPNIRTVDVHIGQLRKKLGDSPASPVIQTLEREGYRWLLPVTPV